MENKEREATNTEFNETKKLVEAVLERLTFHAFEEVLIWSNQHASSALTRCLKKTLDEFENGELILTSSYPKLKHFSVDSVVKGLMTTIDQAQERQDNLNNEIEDLTSQLAKQQTKSQATHEGFVLVPKDELTTTYYWEGAEYAVSCVSEYEMELENGEIAELEKWEQTKSIKAFFANIYSDEDNFEIVEFDSIEAAELAIQENKAMIEAQEQSHDSKNT